MIIKVFNVCCGPFIYTHVHIPSLSPLYMNTCMSSSESAAAAAAAAAAPAAARLSDGSAERERRAAAARSRLQFEALPRQG